MEPLALALAALAAALVVAALVLGYRRFFGGDPKVAEVVASIPDAETVAETSPEVAAKIQEAAAASAAAVAAAAAGDRQGAMEASIKAAVAVHQSGGAPSAVAAANAAAEAASRVAQTTAVQGTATSYGGVVTKLDDVTADGFAKLTGIPDHMIPGLRFGPEMTVEAARAACVADNTCVAYLVNTGKDGDAGIRAGMARTVNGPDAANDRWVQNMYTGIGLPFYRKRY